MPHDRPMHWSIKIPCELSNSNQLDLQTRKKFSFDLIKKINSSRKSLPHKLALEVCNIILFHLKNKQLPYYILHETSMQISAENEHFQPEQVDDKEKLIQKIVAAIQKEVEKHKV
jgi:hypothetical protein